MNITFRGWQGHFCCRCQWHLNTLIEHKGRKIIVSTVGEYYSPCGKRETLSAKPKSYFETMIFESDYGEYDDADVAKQLWNTAYYENEMQAQAGHYEVIKYCKNLLREGKIIE